MRCSFTIGRSLWERHHITQAPPLSSNLLAWGNFFGWRVAMRHKLTTRARQATSIYIGSIVREAIMREPRRPATPTRPARWVGDVESSVGVGRGGQESVVVRVLAVTSIGGRRAPRGSSVQTTERSSRPGGERASEERNIS